MRKIAAVISPLLTFVLYAVIVWGETGGIAHAFRQHGLANGFVAVFVPPVAWYRGAEFFWHHSDSQVKSAATPESYPELTIDETDRLSQVIGKAMQEPLTPKDVASYKAVVRAYSIRTSRPPVEAEGEWLLRAANLDYEYQRELGRCILNSFDSREPFFSERLLTLRPEVEKAGRKSSKTENDWRIITAAGHRSSWTDESGEIHEPLTREEILDGLRQTEIVRQNLDLISSSFHQVAQEFRH
ncbi:MAG TPA: hypothetical protein VFU50_16550 [Terriglobales bacterium]|nr:hypothetical protein [Terriglobales bacterium]